MEDCNENVVHAQFIQPFYKSLNVQALVLEFEQSLSLDRLDEDANFVSVKWYYQPIVGNLV